MNFMRIAVPIAGAALIAMSWRSYGWGGVALVSGGIVMWMLLHFHRVAQVLRRASNRPIGHVDSAVMLHSRLRTGLTLLHVVGLARALGEQVSPKDTQPEVFRWMDGSGSQVTGRFAGGKLAEWSLERPGEPAGQSGAPGGAAR